MSTRVVGGWSMTTGEGGAKAAELTCVGMGGGCCCVGTW